MKYQSVLASLRRDAHLRTAEFLHYSGLLGTRRCLRTRVLGKDQVCVLGFHRVLSTEELSGCDSLPGMIMKQSTFSSLLEYVRHRYRVIGLEELESTCSGFPKPRCLITFDDGWKDNYTRAFPWLARYGVPATVFLATGFIGGNIRFWVEQLIGAWKDPASRQKMLSSTRTLFEVREKAPSLDSLIECLKRMSAAKREGILKGLLPARGEGNHRGAVDEMLNWEEVAEMSTAGIDFGAHTVTHPLLTYEDDGTIERELRQAKQNLEAKLKRNVRAFAYPNGEWDARVRGWVQATGYEYAFTTQAGWHRVGRDPYTIRRILLHEGNVTGQDGQFSPAMFNLTVARSD